MTQLSATPRGSRARRFAHVVEPYYSNPNPTRIFQGFEILTYILLGDTPDLARSVIGDRQELPVPTVVRVRSLEEILDALPLPYQQRLPGLRTRSRDPQITHSIPSRFLPPHHIFIDFSSLYDSARLQVRFQHNVSRHHDRRQPEFAVCPGHRGAQICSHRPRYALPNLI